MNDYIDIYCERTLPGLWSEPLNFVSNISFFIAAWAILQLARRQQKISRGILILMTLVTSIGIGSVLFHTLATEWASLLDMIPIGLFQFVFLWLYSRQIIKMKSTYSGALLVGFFWASYFAARFTNVLNGSLSYAPAFLALLVFGLYHYQQRKNEALILLAAAGIFMLALIFRSLDAAICPYFPTGTHFLWHLCNGILLYLSARALILNRSVMAKIG